MVIEVRTAGSGSEERPLSTPSRSVEAASRDAVAACSSDCTTREGREEGRETESQTGEGRGKLVAGQAVASGCQWFGW